MALRHAFFGRVAVSSPGPPPVLDPTTDPYGGVIPPEGAARFYQGPTQTEPEVQIVQGGQWVSAVVEEGATFVDVEHHTVYRSCLGGTETPIRGDAEQPRALSPRRALCDR